MSRRLIGITKSATMLRIIVVATAVSNGGCAYFHPAFSTRPPSSQAASSGNILVCEMRSLQSKFCTQISRDDLNGMMREAIYGY
jgi:hypothetical protein